MDDVEVVDQLVNHRATFALGKDSPCSPAVRTNAFYTGSAAQLARELDLQINTGHETTLPDCCHGYSKDCWSLMDAQNQRATMGMSE